MNIRFPIRKWQFWILFGLCSLATLFFSWYFFPRAFPIIHIDITMDRTTAQIKAKQLAESFGWGPEHYQQAVSFEEELEAKHFIELEGGGKEKLIEILEEKYYSPYIWLVRHFKEYDALETYIKFTPEGMPYGFEQKIPETLEGAALSQDQARTIAESTATKDWQIDFKIYKFVESSQEKQPSGRIDHTFVYERTDKNVGEGKYRLKLVISGDKLTELSLFLKVPEAFTRRYEHMRSANNALAFAAEIAMVILYLFIGCMIGLAYLHRRHWLIWRSPVIVGCFISLLLALNTLNSLPLRWMYYDTAIAKISFIANVGISFIATFIGYSIFLIIIFMTAEGLTRAAFGNHPQLWSIWRPEAASSFQILGRTVAGYLLVPFDMMYIVTIYLIASRYLGWWSPAETLFNPNVLATYIPWLSAITQSLNAGFMEECLFRAIPIAGAALIGGRFGNQKFFIALAFIIQAIVFGGAHANYPAQPAYARLVELILPSLFFGWVYFRFGLLTTIIWHFIYDVVWFSLPIFIATAAGIWVDKIALILIGLIPLWIVIHSRMKIGYWSELADIFYNRAWLPTEIQPRELKHIIFVTKPRERKRIAIMAGLGLLSTALWFATTRFTQDNKPLLQIKQIAVQKSSDYLNQHAIKLSPEYTRLTDVQADSSDQHRFIWRTAGQKSYHALLGSYLLPVHWYTRFAQFAGDIAQRAEEYGISLDGGNNVMNFMHVLAESQVGKALGEDEARKKAHEFITTWFKKDPKQLTEISAVSAKLPERVDWTFTFSDPTITDLKTGQARIEINIAGDIVAGHNRYIFVPEDWQRIDRQEQVTLNIIKMLCIVIALLFALFASLYVLKNWHLFQFPLWLFSAFFCLLIFMQLFDHANHFETIMINFSTAQPLFNQLVRALVQLILLNIVIASLIAYLASIATTAKLYMHVHHTIIDRLILSFGIAGFVSATNAILKYVIPQTEPLNADYAQASAYFPVAGFVIQFMSKYIINTVIMLLMVILLDYVGNHKKNRQVISFIVAVLLGIITSGIQMSPSVTEWFFSGIASGVVLYAVYWYVLRYDRSIVPFVIFFIFLGLSIQQIAFNAWQGITIASVASLILIFLISFWWSALLERMQTRKSQLPIS